MIPGWRGGRPPINLVTNGSGGRFPTKPGGGLHDPANGHFLRSRRGPGKGGQANGIDSRKACCIFKVHELQQIPVLNSVFHSDILVLLAVILVGFHDPNPGKARVIERAVVSPSSEAIQAVDQHGVHLRHVGLRQLVYVPGQLSGYPIDLPAVKATRPPLPFRFGRRDWLGEDPEIPVAHRSVHPADIPDHVVVEDPCDLPAILHGIGR